MGKPQPATITLRDRYAGAWGEISARLNSRQNVMIAFAAISCTVLSLTAAKRPPDNSTLGYAGLLLPFLAIAFALWVCHNDTTLGLLAKFCEECEKWEDEESLHAKVPSWFSHDQGFLGRARLIRISADLGFVIVLLTTGIPAFLGVIDSNPRSWRMGALCTISAFAALFAAGSVLYNYVRRQSMAKTYGLHADKEGKLRLGKDT